MKNQDYLERIIKLLKSFKKDYPDFDISQIISMSTDCKNFCMTNKELYNSIEEYKDILDTDVTSLGRKDILEILEETEDLFQEIEPEDEDDFDYMARVK